jgi:hypothetical protein
MNRKLYFRLLYYLLGTFIVVTVFSIVTYNFVRDSRLFAGDSHLYTGGLPTATESIDNTNPIIVWQRSSDITPALQTIAPATTVPATYQRTVSRTIGVTGTATAYISGTHAGTPAGGSPTAGGEETPGTTSPAVSGGETTSGGSPGTSPTNGVTSPVNASPTPAATPSSSGTIGGN